ncbi:MAG: molecular chaperone TorD family protein [Planctomycetes bacterium]|nr:molecular chaperone TorD family protein [Planctomycetota bacterium]
MEQLLIQKNLRADVYRILAECYRRPDEGFLRSLGCLGAPGETTLDQIVHAAAASDIEKLQIDHARLFIGPYKLLAPPYGSVYLEDGALMGNSTVNVEEFYREEGMEASDQDVPDHITAEMEFMYVLIGKEVEAVEAGEFDTACDYRQKQKTFIGVHLGAWTAEFADRVLQNAQTEFYRTLGLLTGQFVREDLQLLSTDSLPLQTAMEPDK